MAFFFPLLDLTVHTTPIFRFTPLLWPRPTGPPTLPTRTIRDPTISLPSLPFTLPQTCQSIITGQSCFLEDLGVKMLKPHLQLELCKAAACRSKAVSPRPCRHRYAASTRNLMQLSFMMPSFVEVGYLLAPVRSLRAALHRTIVRCTSPLFVRTLLRRIP